MNLPKIVWIMLIFFLNVCSLEASPNKIIAIVGNDVITEYDVLSKARMIAFFNHFHSNQIINNTKLKKDVVYSLVEENLIANQAKKLDITITDSEFSQALLAILEKTNINNSELKRAIDSNLFDKNNLLNFIKNEIFVHKIVTSKIIPELQSSNLEYNSFKEIITRKINKTQANYHLFQFDLKSSNLNEEISNIKISNCSEISRIAKQHNLPKILDTKVSIKDLNSKMANVILNKNSDNGLFIQRDNSDSFLIGFCKIESDTKQDMINDQQIDGLYKNDKVSKAIHNNIQNLYSNNYILIKN